MTRSLRSLALSLVALVTLASAAHAAPPPTESYDAATRKVKVVMNLVRTQFLTAEPESKLSRGALDGLKKALVDAKRDTGFLDSQPSFEAAFAAAAKKYPDLLQDGTLTRASMAGMMGTLGDPYTTYLTSAEYRKLLEGLGNGTFGGVGVYISTDEKTKELVVVEPMEGGPAHAAGVKARDVITAIDGKPVANMDTEAAKNALRGEPGTRVVLTLRRGAESLEATVTREVVRVTSVSSRVESHAGHKIGYVRVRQFGMTTGKELEQALNQLDAENVEGYVLDLRNNGGGYITAAVDLLSQFLPAQTRLVSVAERGQAERVYVSKGNNRSRLPLALLVNDHSASASEITAGAIQDHGAGVLVGLHTYGKGSVQKIIPLADLSAVKLTTAHYHTPSGKDIHTKGIEPDVKVEMAADQIGSENDIQLERALEIVVGQLARASR